MRKRRARPFRQPKAWWAASLGAFLGLVVELGIWFIPHIITAFKEPAYVIQFCLVLGTDLPTGCVQVQYQHSPGGFSNVYRSPDEAPDRQGNLEQRQQYIAQYQVGYEYPCYYTGSNRAAASFTRPRSFNGLYLSILVALCLLALLMLCLYMASLPSPAPSGRAPAPGVPVLAGAGQAPEPDVINKAIVQALRDADENLKKRIIALATKLENERDARLELAQRISQTAEFVPQAAFKKSPLGKRTKGNAVVPYEDDLQLEAV